MKAEIVKSKPGRHDKYRPEYDALVAMWRRQGAVFEEIADKLSVNIATIYRWKGKFATFREAISTSAELADSQVDCAHFKICTGFYYTEEAATKDGPIQIERYCPPNERAIRFWRINRQRSLWTETQRHELSGPNGGPIEIRQPVDLRAVDSDELRHIVEEAKRHLAEAAANTGEKGNV